MAIKEIAYGVVVIAAALYTVDSILGVTPSDLYNHINAFVERLSP